MKITDIYQGKEKMCPRCKGHKYILGQKRLDDGFGLPNYNHIEKGICFLCDGKGTAFHTLDNRVLKLVKTKNNKGRIIEFNPFNGKKKGTLSECELKNISSNVDGKKDYKISEEECLFPSRYEMIWCDSSKIADVIVEEYPRAKAISINDFYDYEDGYCINFLFYYDLSGKPIKPFYLQPPYDIEDSYKGIIILPGEYLMGVSGTYSEEKDMLYFGVKTANSFKSFEVKNMKDNIREFKKITSINEKEVDILLKSDGCKKIISSVILTDAINLAKLS